MTWGSNASFSEIPCRFCGKLCTDDEDEGLSTHEQTCKADTRFRNRAYFGLIVLVVFFLVIAASAAWSGAHLDEGTSMPYSTSPPDPVTITTGIWTANSTDDSGEYLVKVTPSDDYYADVTFTNRLVIRATTPDEFHFVMDDGEVVIVIIDSGVETGNYDAPDTITVLPPSGYVAIPNEISVEEGGTVVIEIHPYLLG